VDNAANTVPLLLVMVERETMITIIGIEEACNKMETVICFESDQSVLGL